jgi:Fur family transcriptional regulator, ferric uptake regulator
MRARNLQIARPAPGPARHKEVAGPGRLAEIIQERGLRRSRQRDLVARTFFAMGGHVPVDSLVARVRQEDPRVSVATVYRAMKLLADSGLAVPRDFGDGRARYEPASHRHGHSHDHLICTGCGAVVEFESHRVEELQRRVAQRHGFEVQRRHVELYGRCAACRGKPAEQGAA